MWRYSLVVVHPIEPIAHALAAANRVLLGMKWTLDGTNANSAPQLVCGGRDCLELIDPLSVPTQHRMAFFDLKRGIKAVAYRSIRHWDVERVERAVRRFRRRVGLVAANRQQPKGSAQQAEPESEDTPPAISRKPLPARCQQVYDACCAAVNALGQRITDRQAYDWVKQTLEEQGAETASLHEFDTWRRYLRDARNHYGCQKSRPRAGREGRSIVRREAID